MFSNDNFTYARTGFREGPSRHPPGGSRRQRRHWFLAGFLDTHDGEHHRQRSQLHPGSGLRRRYAVPAITREFRRHHRLHRGMGRPWSDNANTNDPNDYDVVVFDSPTSGIGRGLQPWASISAPPDQRHHVHPDQHPDGPRQAHTGTGQPPGPRAKAPTTWKSSSPRLGTPGEPRSWCSMRARCQVTVAPNYHRQRVRPCGPGLAHGDSVGAVYADGSRANRDLQLHGASGIRHHQGQASGQPSRNRTSWHRTA